MDGASCPPARADAACPASATRRPDGHGRTISESTEVGLRPRCGKREGEFKDGGSGRFRYLVTGASISFDGYRVQYTIGALPLNPNNYVTNTMNARADRIAVTDAAAVPEPVTLALLGPGLGWSRRTK